MSGARTTTGYALALLVLVTGACADGAPTAPAARPAALTPEDPRFEEDGEDGEGEGEDGEDGEGEEDDSDELLSCPVSQRRTARKTIGRGGGTLYVGRHKLTIPAGALAQPVTITASQVAGAAPQVEFQPHGLQFARPARLTLDYSHCRVPGWPPLAIVYYTTDAAGLHIEEYLDAAWTGTGDEDEDEDDEGGARLAAALEHFSGYAVAYRTRTRRTY